MCLQHPGKFVYLQFQHCCYRMCSRVTSVPVLIRRLDLRPGFWTSLASS